MQRRGKYGDRIPIIGIFVILLPNLSLTYPDKLSGFLSHIQPANFVQLQAVKFWLF